MCICPRCTTKLVTMRAFTGMRIGEFPVIHETSDYIIVETRTNQLKFSKKTGRQVNAKKPAYANMIEAI